VRWTIERVRSELATLGATDPIAIGLVVLATRLLEGLLDVTARVPARHQLGRLMGSPLLGDTILRRGIEAMAWVVEERGLGGGRELDGLSWSLPLSELWESYVESVVRREAALTGGVVKVGRSGETVVPIHWSDSAHRSLGHLLPDIVVLRGRSVRIVDAKYKAHLAELDESGWHRFADHAREAHRADVHQVLAYAALYGVEEVTATLVYPLRLGTWEALRARGRDLSRAEVHHGGRSVRLELRGLPFGVERAEMTT